MTSMVFGTQLIGQTEKALNALLSRELAGTGVSEPQWVALTLSVRSEGHASRTEIADRLAGAMHISGKEARTLLESLETSGLLDPDPEVAAPSAAGRELHERVRTAVAEITERLWGDLGTHELEVAGEVLSTVLERANGELGAR